MNYNDFHRRSIEQRDDFWAEQAAAVHWQQPFEQVCDHSRPPFARWFVGGRINLCHNAVDRHLADRAEQNALIWVSTEVDQERIYSFRELHAEVQRMAAVLLALGVQQGDRVLIYMPMVAQAVFAMLACARIGAIHSVVFGGFASGSLASRIDDAMPALIVSADAGSRAGKVVPYKPLLDEAIQLAQHKPGKVLLVDRGLAQMDRVPGRDVDFESLRAQHMDAQVPCTWLDSTDPSYILYTSGTTGKPKGVQRDEQTGEELSGAQRKGVVAIAGPLPPGCMQTVWRDDARFVQTYWSSIPGRQVYSTFDWGVHDEDGYYFILRRTDDVINVAGHRLGTREIEESIAGHAGVAEVAVVGVADALKGRVALAFVVLRDPGAMTDPAALLRLEGELMKHVDQRLGAVARPARVRFVTVLPKTRSGKLLRRAIQAVCERRDPGDLTTIEDPGALQQIKDLFGAD
jgi:acyl-coenzyme A synthetase/AMP-(fatty) acid ligase